MLHPDLRLFVCLQNAYTDEPLAAPCSYNRWLSGLRHSRTGGVLLSILGNDAFQPLPDGAEFDYACEHLPWIPPTEGASALWCFFGNTTPKFAQGNAWLPPDPAHVLGLMLQYQPNAVLACGEQARNVLDEIGYGGPMVCIPHPTAWKQDTGEDVLCEAARLLACGPERCGRTLLRRDRQSRTLVSQSHPRPAIVRLDTCQEGTAWVFRDREIPAGPGFCEQFP